MAWVPPELRNVGITELQLDVLLDTCNPRSKRRMWPDQNVVVERAYSALSKDGLIEWKQVHPHHTSLADDHYVVTSKGAEVIKKLLREVERIGTPSTKRKRRA